MTSSARVGESILDEIDMDDAALSAAVPNSAKSGSSWRQNKWFLRSLSIVVVMTFWQVFGQKFPYTTSYPTAVWKSAVKTFFTDVLPAFKFTLETFGIGFAICIIIGVPVGFAMARLKPVQLVIEPYTVMLFSIPIVAMFPVLLVAFGVSFGLRIAVVVVTGIFPIIINTFLGAQRVDPSLADVGKTFVASPWKTLTTIIAPGSLPYVFAGIRIGFARGMIGAVVIELEASAIGVGSLMQKDAQNLAMDNFFVVLLLLGTFSLCATLLIRKAASWSTEPWKRKVSRRALSEVERISNESSALSVGSPQARIIRPTSPALIVLRSLTARPASAWRRFRPLLDTKWASWLVRISVFGLIVAYWQYKSKYISRAVLPSPRALLSAGYSLIFGTHEVIAPLLNSLMVLGLGFGLSVVIGIPVGLIMGRSKIIENVADPYVSFIYALPHVSFVPLMIVWLGFGIKFRLAYVVISAVFPVIINTMTGVKNIDPELVNTGRSFCASNRSIMRTIIIPGATPFMIAGARLAFSAAWVGVVVGEILSTQDGLGGLISRYSDSFNTAEMMVPIILIMAIAVLILKATTYLQAHLTPWYEADIRR
jgi:ABC-type nitrate/sulfonate/bicarbonate transport system permease component